MRVSKFDAVIIYDKTEEHYVAICKQLRGVSGNGKSTEEAMSKLKINLGKYADYIKSANVVDAGVTFAV
jgi:predicted RNase H-like HicB family nuclease